MAPRPPDGTPAVAPPITTIATAFALWPDLAVDTQPVDLEGVVTAVMPSGAFRLHDGELGLYVTKAANVPHVTAGERVRVQGVLRQAGFSPWITPRSLVRLGYAPFPPARPVTFGALATGAMDNQWVEIEGVVRAADVPALRDFAVLDLGMEGGNLRVFVSYRAGDDYAALIDAEVRIRGVAAVNVNAHRQVVEPSFRVPSLAEITVLRPGEPDPFARPVVPASRILRVAPGVPERHHRVCTGGVVTRQLSRTTLFVRDGDVGLKVETSVPEAFRPGDRIEVAGFPVIKDGMAVLERARARRVGTAVPPAPVTLAGAEGLLDGKYNSDLVRVDARLVDWVRAGPNVTLVFQAGDQLFKGLLNLPAGAALTLPEKNSWVNVTGICVIGELEDVWFYQPLSFVLLVADLADVRLVQAPPWWTAERLWRALATACAILLAVAGWVWALRRQIGRTRAVIEQQARHAAALEERSRIARDLHDTLEQGLTGLSLQMKAIEADFERGADVARERLQAARQMLRQSRALARDAIRELRSELSPVRQEDLIDGLRRIAANWNGSGVPVVTVQVRGPVRVLPAEAESQLLGIATEAVTNAVKHGRAREIRIDVEAAEDVLVLRVADNGAGFDAARPWEQAGGCFGLLGMRERARELQGELRITSRPGQGTEVVVAVPRPTDGAAARPRERAVAPLPATEAGPA